MAKKHCWISNIAARRLTGVKAVCLYCREVRYDNLRGGTCPGANEPRHYSGFRIGDQ